MQRNNRGGGSSHSYPSSGKPLAKKSNIETVISNVFETSDGNCDLSSDNGKTFFTVSDNKKSSSTCDSRCNENNSADGDCSVDGGSEIALEEVVDVLLTPLESAAAERVRQFLLKEKISDCRLVRVQKNYYSLTLEQRRDLLGAPSIDHLCKTVVVENTKHIGADEKLNSRYYLVILSYPRRLNGERVKDLIKAVNAQRNLKLGNKKLNFNFCKEGERLTGFVYNTITPFGSLLRMPVLLDSAVAALQPPFVWLGGGEETLKVVLPLSELQRVFEPLVGNVTFET